MKPSSIGIGFSHQSVPSLSNTADPLGRANVVGPTLLRHAFDEVDDRPARRRVAPGGERVACALAFRHSRISIACGLALEVDVRLAADVDGDAVGSCRP